MNEFIQMSTTSVEGEEVEFQMLQRTEFSISLRGRGCIAPEYDYQIGTYGYSEEK